MERRRFLFSSAGIGLARSWDAGYASAASYKNARRNYPGTAIQNGSPLGYIVKKKSTDIQDSPFGLQFFTAEDEVFDLLLDRMHESGAKWTRVGASWGRVETTKGHYDWSTVDRTVDGLTKRGVNIFLLVSGSNRLYHSYPEGYIYPPTRVPEALDAFCRFAGKLVERYNDRVMHYEIYNEPNIRSFWQPAPDAGEYGLLVQRAGEAIHSANGNVKVIAGVLAGVGDAQNAFIEGFMSSPDVLKQVDILSYHPYNPHPELSSERVAAMRAVLDTFKPGLPVLQGECGCPSSGDTIHFRGDAPWGYNVQSKWLLRRLLTDRLDGAIICIYFLNVEFYGTLNVGDPKTRKGYNTKGLIQYTTWEAKPAYYTLQNLAAVIDTSCKPVNEKANIEVIEPGIFYGIGPHEDRFPCAPWQITMRKNGKPMLAYWLPWRPQEIIKPATVRISWPGVSWNEPVCVDLLSGAVFEATAKGGALEVPFADYPLIVTELSLLELEKRPQQPSHEEILSKLRWTY